jgi:GT2 family glycosyltransferase
LSRDKGLSFATKAIIWKFKTAAFKRKVILQDRFALYPYPKWIEDNEAANKELSRQRIESQNLPYQPRFSVIVVGDETEAHYLKNTLNSLLDQTYNKWDACLVSTSEHDLVFDTTVADIIKTDERIHHHQWKAHDSSNPIMQALSTAQGEFIVKLNAGDKLSPDAIFEVAKALNSTHHIDIIYSDEDFLAEDGHSRQEPFFKPDWSPELVLSTNYLLHAFVRRNLLNKIFSKTPSNELTSFGDLVFRCIEQTQNIHHIPQVLHHRRKTNGDNPDHPGSVSDLQSGWVEAHLERMGITGAKASIPWLGTIQVKWPATGSQVSIIIPTKDHTKYLKRCITSIQELTNYQNYEFIIVDSGSHEEDTQQYYSNINQIANIHFTNYSGEFNFSAALNLGAIHAQGDILLFLNNDTEVIDADWLDELVRWAERPEIGIVGAKLLYPDRTIQHAGIVLGMEGHGSHVFGGVREGHHGPFGSGDWYRDYTAVTGACMAMRREVFNKIGGFDEHYQLVFSDIEICLRVIEAGYRVVYTPFARLIHHEGMTRFRYIPTHDIMLGYTHTIDAIENGDPFYNPNLSYSVRVPTLRRPDEESPVERLKNITLQV